MRFRIPAVVGCLLLAVVACGKDDGASADVETTGTRVLATVTVGQEVHYAGFLIDVDEVVHRPRRVTVTATATNLGAVSTTPPLKVSLDDGTDIIDMEIELSRVPVVPPEGAADVAYAFRVPEDYDLSQAVLLVGRPDSAQASVPLGRRGALKTNAPQALVIEGEAPAGNMVFRLEGGEMRISDAGSYSQPPAGQARLTIRYSVENRNNQPIPVNPDAVRLVTPTGQTLVPTSASTGQVPANGVLTGLSATFLVDAEEAGTYTFVGLRNLSGATAASAELEFEVPAFS